MRVPTLRGSIINLRSLRRADIPSLVRYANDRTIARLMPSLPYPYGIDHARRFVNCAHRTARKDTCCHFGIELADNDDMVGVIGMKNLAWHDKNAELEYWVGRPFRRRGIASEALRLVLEFAFDDLNLHRVYAVVVAVNTASVRLLEKSRFEREMTWREACHLGHRWHDVYGYGLLHREFRKGARRCT